MDKLTFIAWITHGFWFGYVQALLQHPSQLLPTMDDLASSRNGIQFLIDHPGASAKDLHDNWMAFRISQGWTYGKVKDVVKKEHPDLVPWNELKDEERRKDYNFWAGVQYGEAMWKEFHLEEEHADHPTK